MSLFTKLGNDIASPVDANGAPRSVDNGDMQRWMTESERLLLALVAGEGGDIDLPNLLIRYTITGGTANAIEATANLPIPSAPGEALYAIQIAQDNTGPVTVNGKPLLTNSGNEIVPGGLVAGGIYLFLDDGTAYRLLSDYASAAIVATAEDAAGRAEAAAAGVNLPSIQSGDGGKQLYVKPDQTGYELRASVPLLILVAGQSNAARRASYTWTAPANLKMWTYSGSSYSDAGASTTVGTFEAAPENVSNYGLFIGEAAALAFPNRPVYVVNISRGGVPISTYISDSSDPKMYVALQANMTAALVEINAAHPESQIDKIDAFFWWQGESDASLNNLNYPADFETLHARLRGEDWFDYMTPVVLAGFSRHTAFDAVYGAYTNQIKLVVANEARVRRYIDPGSLPEDYWDQEAGSSVEYIHMTAEGYRRAGQMAFDAWAKGVHEVALPKVTYSDYHDVFGVGVQPNSNYYWHWRKDIAGAMQVAASNIDASASASASLSAVTAAGYLRLLLNNAGTPTASVQSTAQGNMQFSATYASANMQWVINSVERMRLNAAGALIQFPPSSAQALGVNGMVTMEFTNNTTLTFRARGSDGTIRTATLTLT